MSVGTLLFDLRRLLDAPAPDRKAVEKLLRRHRKTVEYEVALSYVASRGMGAQDQGDRLRSPDPRVRLQAVRDIDLWVPRSRAAQLLRRVAKDPDRRTRAAAGAATRALELSDVALPDWRAKIGRYQRVLRTTPGAWNPTGWFFGVYHRRPRYQLRSETLAAHGLPVLRNDSDIAALVGLPDGAALTALQRPGTAKGSPYVEFEIDKATGGKRSIAAPRPRLRAVQRVILRQLLDRLPVHDAAHGFVRGRSTVTNAAPHARATVVIKMDLQDFFPSIHFHRVRGLFQLLGYDWGVASTLASLCIYRPVLADGTVAWPGVVPQGAPTSPAIANLVCRRLDARLSALAAKAGALYTRYADDLTFSFVQEPATLGRFLWWVDQICQQEGFAENVRKRRVLRTGHQQRVTGIVVNSALSVPRRDRRRFRAILTNIRKYGLESEARDRRDFKGYLRGFAAYVKMVQPELGSRLVLEVEQVLAEARGFTQAK